MSSQALYWLLLNLFSIIMLAFYSMLEMASVSFNRVRLQYYVSKGIKRAEWLNWLLQHPTRLFGTTLIGVNVATIFGSEFAREFHQAVGINPDFSPISQVLIVVIFGELAPMFAARRYAEHVAMLGVPLIYASAKLMAPIIWIFSAIAKLYNWTMGISETRSSLFLTQEELQKILEEQEEDIPPTSASEELNAVTANIFNLRLKSVHQVMEPLDSLPSIPSNASVEQVREALRPIEADYALVIHRQKDNVIGVVHARDLIRAPSAKRARDYARPPWFVPEDSSIMQILNQFRHNNQEMGIILNARGQASGILHIDDIMEEIFGRTIYAFDETEAPREEKQLSIDRTFPGDMTVGAFNRQFDVILDPRDALTLAELMVEQLGHEPEVGESLYIPPFELIVTEASMLEIKSIKIRT